MRGTTAKTVPGDQPGRTQDTGDRADRTAVRGRAKAQGIEVKHRRRVPAEPLVEFKAATGQQNPGHPSLPGYAVSRSCRIECILIEQEAVSYNNGYRSSRPTLPTSSVPLQLAVESQSHYAISPSLASRPAIFLKQYLCRRSQLEFLLEKAYSRSIRNQLGRDHI